MRCFECDRQAVALCRWCLGGQCEVHFNRSRGIGPRVRTLRSPNRDHFRPRSMWAECASLENWSQKPRGRSPTTPSDRSSASPAVAIVPSSNNWPISVTPCGTLRGGENFGSG